MHLKLLIRFKPLISKKFANFQLLCQRNNLFMGFCCFLCFFFIVFCFICYSKKFFSNYVWITSGLILLWKIYNLSQISLESDDNHLDFYYFGFWAFGLKKDFSLRDPATIAGDCSDLIRELSLLYLMPNAFSSKFISFSKSNNRFISDSLARSTSQFVISNRFQKFFFRLKFFIRIPEYYLIAIKRNR